MDGGVSIRGSAHRNSLKARFARTRGEQERRPAMAGARRLLFKSRGIFMVGFQCVALVGIISQIASNENHAKYAGVYLLTIGLYPCVPMGTAWNSNKIGGSTKRAVGIAMQIAAGNLGGVASGFIYIKNYSPRYLNGHCTMLGTITVSIILCACQSVHLRRENARRDEVHKPLSEYTAQDKREERELGDYATFYRFTV